MKKRILALALALTMCFGTTMTTNAAMIVKNNMGALNTSNILDKNKSEIPKGYCRRSLQNTRSSILLKIWKP